MKSLTEAQVSQALGNDGDWNLEDGKLNRTWHFPDFVQAIDFVNRVAQLAEQASHHPDILIRYNSVRLSLVTHDAGGLTERDLSLATNLSKTFPKS